MLLHRVLTALVLLPLLLGAVFLAPAPVLYAVFSLAAMLAAREWAALMRWGHRPRTALAYALAMGGLLLALGWLPGRDHWLPWLLAVAGVHWLLALAWLARYPVSVQRLAAHPISAVQGALLLSTTVLACSVLHGQEQGAYKLLFALFLVFAADVGAYLAGRNFGRRKLAPAISPGKTLEGALGGVALCGLWAMVAGVWVFQLQGAQALAFILLCVVVAAFSVAGDLLESAFKRVADVKDSGTLLPGHGGVLDRIDSVLAALPLFVLGLMWLELA